VTVSVADLAQESIPRLWSHPEIHVPDPIERELQIPRELEHIPGVGENRCTCTGTCTDISPLACTISTHRFECLGNEVSPTRPLTPPPSDKGHEGNKGFSGPPLTPEPGGQTDEVEAPIKRQP